MEYTVLKLMPFSVKTQIREKVVILLFLKLLQSKQRGMGHAVSAMDVGKLR